MLELSQRYKYTVKINDILLNCPKRLFGNVVSVYILYISLSAVVWVVMYVVEDSALQAPPKRVLPATLTTLPSKAL